MRNFALYALPSDDQEAMKAKIEPLLGIEFEGRHSDERGDYYSTRGFENKVRMYTNLEESGEMWNEEKFREFPLLLSIEDSPHLDGYHDLLTGEKGVGAVLIIRREWPNDGQAKALANRGPDFYLDE